MPHRPKSKRRKKSRSRVSKKISILRHEGTPQKQAVATALSMERKHRITKSGGYRRVKKHKRRSHRRR